MSTYQNTKLACTLLLFMAVSTWSITEEIIRETKQGKVRGRRYLSPVPMEVYIGIPYAEPPIGDLRFKPPVPRSPWEGIYDSPPRGTACPQTSHPLNPKEDVEMTEDCLHINIWVPLSESTKKVPVLVWLHVGGFTYGSASHVNSNATRLAALTGCIVVAMNYRLGVLGFLNGNSPDAPGNLGFYDQRLALEWVQDNIETFGGDSSTVTLVGMSSGSLSVQAHILSPMSKGLFKRAVMMSGAMHNLEFYDSLQVSMKKADDLSKGVGCAREGKDLSSHPQEVIRCLRSKEADELLLKAKELAFPSQLTFSPTFHDRFLPKAPFVAVKKGFFNNVDLILGVTSDESAGMLLLAPIPELLVEEINNFDQDAFERALEEVIAPSCKFTMPDMVELYKSNVQPGDLKALRKAYVDYTADRLYYCPAQFFAERYSASGNSVYKHIFGHKSPKSRLPGWVGVGHGENLRHFMPVPEPDMFDHAPEDEDINRLLANMLASFAEHGVPELPNGSVWPSYSSEKPISIYIAHENITYIHGFRTTRCERWRR